MTLAIWLSLVPMSIVISLTPGAGAINTMSNSITVGWRRAFWGVLGQQIALIVYLVIVAAGVGVFVASSPAILNVTRYLGVAYLVYLGIRQLLSKPSSIADPSAQSTSEPSSSRGVGSRYERRWSLVSRGFWVNILNPKAIVFFLGFVPQFIVADEPLLIQYAIVTATIVVIDILVMWFFFAAAAKPFGGFANTKRGQRIISIIFGVLYIVIGIMLLFLH